MSTFNLEAAKRGEPIRLKDYPKDAIAFVGVLRDTIVIAHLLTDNLQKCMPIALEMGPRIETWHVLAFKPVSSHIPLHSQVFESDAEARAYAFQYAERVYSIIPVEVEL